MTATEAGERLDQLRKEARVFNEEKERQTREHQSRRKALQERGSRERNALQNESDARLATVRQEQEAWRSGFTKRIEARRARIKKTSDARKQAVLNRIEDGENRRKFAVQKGTLDQERSRGENLTAAQRELEQFTANGEQWKLAMARRTDEFRKAFRPYPGFGRMADAQHAAEIPGTNQYGLIDRVKELHEKVGRGLHQSGARILPLIFRIIPVWIWLVLLGGAALAGPERLGLEQVGAYPFYMTLGGIGAVLLFFYLAGWFLCRPRALRMAAKLSEARQLLESALERAIEHHQERSATIRRETSERLGVFNQDWESAVAEAREARERNERESRSRQERVLSRLAALAARQETIAEAEFRELIEAETGRSSGEEERKVMAREDALRELDSAYQSALKKSVERWEQVAQPALEELENASIFARSHAQPWSEETRYEPPADPLNILKIGEFTVPPEALVGSPLAAGATVAGPLNLVLPTEGNLLIETDEVGRARGIQTLNNLVLRILAQTPPGKVVFTFIDPVRLGESFSSLMHLADYEENMVNRRIWTEPAEIEERLFELNTHMEKVIQMYLRNEYADIVAYNEKAGRMAEKYHFLVLADFPANLGETAMRRLLKIITSGARCGVFTLLHWHRRQAFPPGFEAAEFLAHCLHVQVTREGVHVPRLGADVRVWLDGPPEAEVTIRFLKEAGQASVGSNLVQVPFSDVSPAPKDYWTLSTTPELRIAIGRSGANKLQYLALGKGTRQHVLIAGKTGSGKSTLLHVLITNLALSCSPEEVEFYLVDFKKGVEFKDYALAKLPHARVIAIESDREFGLSVLRKLDEELRRRGELFRADGVQDIAAYKEGGKVMPRVLLIVDEFQELFVEDDSISQNASMLLDRIVRQGRAFGLHAILGSQTLGGAYSLARSTLGQMVVRIALQCNEADAYLIMDENNPAPRLLSRPGEGIYNDASGRIEANSPFQVVWLDDKERHQALATVRSLANRTERQHRPVVFEGNHPADLADNEELRALPDAEVTAFDEAPRVWLGMPNEIKGPTEVILDRRSGRNLLIVGQQEEQSRALLVACLLSLGAHSSLKEARFVVLEAGPKERRLLDSAAEALPHKVEFVTPADVESALENVKSALEAREGGEAGQPIFLLVHNASMFKPLRMEEDFSLSMDDSKGKAADWLQKILADGPVQGVHAILHFDSFNNVNRFLGRRGLREFQARVLFQMSASDSASLCDDARASNLGLNRALLYDEQTGVFEIFRPYARPSEKFLGTMRDRLEETAKKEINTITPKFSGRTSPDPGDARAS